MDPWWGLVPLAYVIGSVPWGLLVVRLLRRVDVRDYGSGKTGGTNVLRSAGAGAAVLVLAADADKGAAVVALAMAMTSSDSVPAAAAGAAVAGHVWPLFAGFRGGRGIAIGVGVSLVLEPWIGLVGLAVFAPVVLITRYVSLGSIGGVVAIAATFVVTAALDEQPIAYLGFAIATGPLILFMHRDNVRRLLAGEERRLGERAG